MKPKSTKILFILHLLIPIVFLLVYLNIQNEQEDIPFRNKHFNLGENYYWGNNGYEQNYAKAVKHFKKAADQGYAEAQYKFTL